MAQLKSLLLSGIVFTIPALFVFRFRRFGVLLGTLSFWLLVLAVGDAWTEWPGSSREGEPSADFEDWLIGGWISALAYCFLIWLLRESIFMFRRGFTLYQAQIQLGFNAVTSLGCVWRELNRVPAKTVDAPAKEYASQNGFHHRVAERQGAWCHSLK